MSTIVLTGGGTAGHCTPNLSLLPYLKKHFNKIYYIGSKNGIEKNLVKETDVPYYSITTVKLSRSFNLNNLLLPIKLIKGKNEAGKLLDKLKPDVIFSKGGYVSVPVVLSAKKRDIPVVSHESDLTMGLANSFTARKCEKVLTSFPETAKKIKNGEYVGSPIRDNLFYSEKKTALKYFGLSGKKPVILVTGGSQGATAINNAVFDALSELIKEFDVLHVCGKNNLNSKYKRDGYVQTEYADMSKAYAVADLCISRAGSNTLFELLALKIPSVIIPLPKGNSRGDQEQNATYFQKKGLIYTLPQNALSKNSLIVAVKSLYNNRETFIENLNSYKVQNANSKIVKILTNYTH